MEQRRRGMGWGSLGLFVLALGVMVLLSSGSGVLAQTAEDCMTCTKVVTFAQDLLDPSTGNLTDAKVIEVLEKVCDIVPSVLASTCKSLVANLTDGAIKAFVNGYIPQAICTELRQCFACCITETAPEQVHLSMTLDPTQMVVMWATLLETETSTCQYGIEETNLNMTVTGTTSTYTAGNWSGVLHKATLEGLEPFVPYYYSCGDASGGWSPVSSFVPNSGNLPSPSLRVALVGDMGASIESDFTVGRLVKDVEEGMYDFLLHVGDIGYADDEARGNYEEWEHVWDQFQRKVAPISSRIPYMVCLGNHEAPYNFTAYQSRFAMPGPNAGSPNLYWSMDYNLVHFLGFSSEHDFAPGSLQYNFIQEDLAKAVANRENVPWIIMFMHRPLYCHNDEDDVGDCQRNAPLFRSYLESLVESAKVDLFITAHEHSYERTWPVKNNGTYIEKDFNNPNATVYVVNGSAGGPERLDLWWQTPAPAWAAFWHSTYGYSRMTITASSIQWQFVEDRTGAVIDHFTITKS